MKYYASLFPDNCQQTAQDDLAKLWNLARNVKDDNKLVRTVNTSSQAHCYFCRFVKMSVRDVSCIRKTIFLRENNQNMLSYQIYNLNNVHQKYHQKTIRFHTNLTLARFLTDEYRTSSYTRTKSNHGKTKFWW